MNNVSKCGKCSSEHIYQDGNLWICPECAHEWSALQSIDESAEENSTSNVVRDAYNNVLVDGDSITLIKELKIKGSSSSVKVGTKVKRIRIIDSTDGHNIACKIDGIGSINLKSEFVKKA